MGKVFTLLERHWYSVLFMVLLGGAVAMLFSRAEKPPESHSLQRALLELSGPFQKGITKGIAFFESTSRTSVARFSFRSAAGGSVL